MTINPYAPPTDASFVPEAPTGPEAIRKQYLSHEASVKSVGTLYLLGAILMVPIGLFLIGSVLAGRLQDVFPAVFGVVYVVLGLLQGATAIGLRRLQPWARIVGIVFSVIGLLGFPIGTLISAYILYLLASQKGNYIFTDEYRRVVEQTPHIKYRTSMIVIILLVILLILFVIGVVAALIG